MLPLILLGAGGVLGLGILWALSAEWPAPDEPDRNRPPTDTPPPGQEP